MNGAMQAKLQTPTCGLEERNSIVASLEQLDSAISAVINTIKELQIRIEPILLPPGPTECTEDSNKVDSISSINERLKTATNLLCRLNLESIELTNRVDL